jgi:hypothetical protein
LGFGVVGVSEWALGGVACGVPPPVALVFGAVVSSAQGDQVADAGGVAESVFGGVVGVAAGGWVGAAGVSAGAVAGGDEVALSAGWSVAASVVVDDLAVLGDGGAVVEVGAGQGDDLGEHFAGHGAEADHFSWCRAVLAGAACEAGVVGEAAAV